MAKNWLKALSVLATAILLVGLLSMPAQGQVQVTGSFAVTGGVLGTDFTYAGNVLTFLQPGTYTVRGQSFGADRIVVNAPGSSAASPVRITLDGVRIDVTGVNTSAFTIMANAHVRLTLAGTNRMFGAGGFAALELQTDGHLILEAINPSDHNSGVLVAQGGAGVAGSVGVRGNGSPATAGSAGGTGGAGIGGGGNLTVSSGSVSATGGAGGVGGTGGTGGWGGTAGPGLPGAPGGTGGPGGNGIGSGVTFTVNCGIIDATGGTGGTGGAGGPGGHGGLGLGSVGIGGSGGSGGVGIGGVGTITVAGGSVDAMGGTGGIVGVGGTGDPGRGGPVGVSGTGGRSGVGIHGAVRLSGGAVYAWGMGGEKDIDGASLSISGSAAVFLRNDNSIAPTTTTHTHSLIANHNAGNIQGIAVPWTGSFGAWLANQPVVAVTSITVTPASATLNVGGTQQLTATIAPSNATNQMVTWVSGNTSVATVSSTGLVTAVIPGTVTITAATVDGNHTASINITVSAPPPLTVAVTGITVAPTTAIMTVGSTQQLTATIAPGNATNQTVTWVSSNTTIATVSSLGLATAVSPGTATITVTTADGGHTAQSTVIISVPVPIWQPVTGVTVAPVAAKMNIGGTQQLVATLSPTHATERHVTWRSSNENVATVNLSGGVTAVGPGVATITVTTSDGGFRATSVITVGAPPVASVSVTPTTASLRVGGTTQITTNVLPPDTTDRRVFWSTSNEAVALVTSTGRVFAVGLGQATITATTVSGSLTASSVITVEPIPVASVSVTPATARLQVGGTTQFTATVLPSDATDRRVSWSSSNPNVATVDSSGIVSARAGGSVVITARTTDGQFSATAEVTVIARQSITLTIGVPNPGIGLDVPPIAQGGRLLVPVRWLTERLLGATVDFRTVNGRELVTIRDGDRVVELTLGSKTARVNGVEIELDVAPYATGGRTLVPARFLAETFGMTVEWNERTNEVTFTEPAPR